MTESAEDEAREAVEAVVDRAMKKASHVSEEAYQLLHADWLRAVDRSDRADAELDELRAAWSESREIVAAATPLLRNVAYLDAAIGDEWLVYCEQVRALLSRIDAKPERACPVAHDSEEDSR